MKKTILFSLLGSLLSLLCLAQKKPLSQAVYSSWNALQDREISPSGDFITFRMNPLHQDPTFFIYPTKAEKSVTIHRGNTLDINFNESYAFIRIKPGMDTIRELKRAKHKKEEMPHDTLAILSLKNNNISYIAHLKSYYCPDKGGHWIALHLEDIPTVTDTTKTDTLKYRGGEKGKKPNKKEEEDPCTKFMVFSPEKSDTLTFDRISDYAMDTYGKSVVVAGYTEDSLAISYIIRIIPEKHFSDTIFSQSGKIINLLISDKGEYCSFLYTQDTTNKKIYSLYTISLEGKTTITRYDTASPGMKKDWHFNPNQQPFFNETADKLFLYTAPIPKKLPKDTLLEEEKCSLDLWNYKDPLLQTMQLKNVDKEKKRGYLAVISPANPRLIQLADSVVPEIQASRKNQGQFLLGSSSLPYQPLMSWDGNYRDIYAINTLNNQRTLILKKQSGHVSLSPGEKYILFWNENDSSWNSYCLGTETFVNLTRNMQVNFYNEEHDMPDNPNPYSVAGWLEEDTGVLISDYYDVWLFDPTGKTPARNLTKSFGRENGIRFTPVNLRQEEKYLALDQKSLLLRSFNTKDKRSGYYYLNETNTPVELITEEAWFGYVKKAKNSEKIIWTREGFTEFPDLWTSNLNFRKKERISHANPQQEDYLWGNAALVSWTSAKGKPLEGVLYTPENLNPEKKYPMLVYFYERNANNLHRHRIPSPSRSTINPSFCTSNGYVVFIPDITYGTGHPGNDCFDAVVSGTLAMCDRYTFIDKERIGLQGQSWGGYQIAHLITRTNLYAAAMAGAPVSNMTSAYGGIRWESGMSRAFQYEKSQSRIGQPLWEAPELYIENSPVFFADRVNTPLLIMHNDNDGAVPWYQGIEYFSALRRLQKPVWMLVYNGAPHNLTRWPDRMDLDRRMMQYFDHFLKNKPAPVWMTTGIPAVKKGIENGFGTE
ncbi:MAG: prolyl oligopeptidase family serine peptidase [Bacteroidales bacterium]|nr:prolyl oligopeptidase family serine peptidase [Bacteroidales bacterium]